MYTYIYIYTYVYSYLSMTRVHFLHSFTQHESFSAYIHKYIYTVLLIYTHTHTHTLSLSHTHTHTNTHTCVCIYIYICIYVYIYTYIHICCSQPERTSSSVLPSIRASVCAKKLESSTGWCSPVSLCEIAGAMKSAGMILVPCMYVICVCIYIYI